MTSRRNLLKAGAGMTLGGAALSSRAFAQVPAQQPVRIGVLTDMSGVFSGISGPGAVAAVQMAVEDFGKTLLGHPLEVLAADHQDKPDIGAAIARKWYDQENVVMINDLMDTAVALAVMNLAVEKHRIAIINGASSSVITNAKCTPNSVHYCYDTYALAKGVVSGVVKHGGRNWGILLVDYGFGYQLAKDTSRFVNEAGGKVIMEVKHPLNTNDFSSFILQLDKPSIDVIALANGGSDTLNAIKTASEFGIGRRDQKKIVALYISLLDLKSLGLETAQGLSFADSFYWNRNEESRKWSERFFAKFKKMPTSAQAANYSSTMHYLRAVEAANSLEAPVVMEKMRAMPVNDFFATNGHIRIDGLMVHDMYLLQVKKPSESKGPWDLCTVLDTIPAAQAFQPLSESTCPLVLKK